MFAILNSDVRNIPIHDSCSAGAGDSPGSIPMNGIAGSLVLNVKERKKIISRVIVPFYPPTIDA